MSTAEFVDVDQILERMCGEYLEMPGLRLTCRQAQRLWGLDESTCVELLQALLDVGFLRQTRDGTFARSADGPAAPLHLRMARAGLEPAVTRDTAPLPRAARAAQQR